MSENFVGEDSCYSNEVSVNFANTYEEAVDRLIRGEAEFVEFPLEALGSSTKELVDLLSNTPSPEFRYKSISLPGTIDSHKELTYSFLEQLLNYTGHLNKESTYSLWEQVLSSSDSNLISSVKEKIDESIKSILSKSSHIKGSSLLEYVFGSRTTASIVSPNHVSSAGWHTDPGPDIKTLITFKGNGTEFCKLSNDEKADFNKKWGDLHASDQDQFRKPISELCTDDKVIQIKPYHGVVFINDNKNTPLLCVHSTPRSAEQEHRIFLSVDKTIGGWKYNS